MSSSAIVYSRVSTKSQTVLPRPVRESLGVGPGDRVRYRVTPAGILIEKAEPASLEDPFATFTEWSEPDDDEAFADL